MKTRTHPFSRLYRKTLQTHLKLDDDASLAAIRGLGCQALSNGLQTLDLAKLHEHLLLGRALHESSPEKRRALIRKAGLFFAAAMTPENAAPGDGRATITRLNRSIATLVQRTAELAASNLELNLEITQRKAVEQTLKNSEKRHARLLAESDRLQENLRRLSRQILSAQEDERKKISRELHDVIAQILTGITIRLAALKKEAAASTEGLIRSIGRTQRLVEKSVEIVHQFARKLRPAVLDDLGLIPALQASLKLFTTRTGIITRMTAFAGVEHLSMGKRTVLFRVAQEALANTEHHAKATGIDVTISHLAGLLTMTLHDDGQSFQVEQVMQARGQRRLGLIGMRERLEMVGGHLVIESAPGSGTSIIAQLPFSPSASHSPPSGKT